MPLDARYEGDVRSGAPGGRRSVVVLDAACGGGAARRSLSVVSDQPPLCTFWLSVWLDSCGRSGENNPVVSTTRKVTPVNEGRVWVFSVSRLKYMNPKKRERSRRRFLGFAVFFHLIKNLGLPLVRHS